MSSAEGLVSPKRKTVGARSGPLLQEAGRVDSTARVRAARARPLTPAEQAAQKEETKRVLIARRRALEEEGAVLKREQERLLSEVARVDDNPEGDGDAYLDKMRQTCDITRLEADDMKKRSEKADRRDRENTARYAKLKVSLSNEREAMREELIEVRERSVLHEERARKLFASCEDMRELLQRGADELQQLREELWERQGEKALLVADQASAARLGAEQRVQAVAAEAQVTQLAQALDCEDSRLAQEQRRLRRAEAQHQERAATEQRAMENACSAFPEQIQKERESMAHAKAIAEEKRAELVVAQEALAKVREAQRQFAELVRAKAAEVWRAETTRDSARSARERIEAETARIATETKNLQDGVKHLDEQNRQLMRDQVKARNDCSALVQHGIRRDIKEFVKANPEVSSSSPQKMDADLEDRAARLGLAGFVTKMSPAGMVGPQRAQ